ncbi:AAA family ATPase [Fulvivirga sp. 29W222]|uniref:AAA family ATPase n=1 Tax=Fulvivirga marina TaxID=2494733 RepID=A0A937G4Y9_9BACT|nr:AAA family ATPase [Fulvivirga marina]MBL6448526.1 AAA family ATPase [Fulvivirga marina]
MNSDTSIKIKKLIIKNFKVYKSQNFDFTNVPLLVFDGANGFGKTTIFDAIELLLTGRIRRYEYIKSRLIDGREKRTENPFYCTEGDGDPIEIRASFEVSGNEVVLARRSPGKENLGADIDFSLFTLHSPETIDSLLGDNNKKSENVLKELLGDNYKNDFEFLHYIEQEDSLYLLKKSERDKKESIAYLFNTSRFQDEIEKYKRVKSTINEFLKKVKEEIRVLKEEVSKVQESLLTQNESQYVRLFSEKNFEWDSEVIKFDENKYFTWLSSENGVLPQLNKLLRYRGDFLQAKVNRKIDRLLINRNELQSFCDYYFFIDKTELLENEKRVYDYIRVIKELHKDFDIENIENGEYDVPQFLKEVTDNSELFRNYENNLNLVKRAILNSNSSSKVLNKLISTRENLIKHQTEFHNEIEENGICQLCGQHWETKEALIQGIDDQTKIIKELNDELNASLSTKIDVFKEVVFPEFIESIEALTVEYLYEPEYFRDDFFRRNLQRVLKLRRRELEELNIDYESYLSKETIFKEERLEEFVEMLTYKKRGIDEENIEPSFDDLFITYFEENEDELNEFDADLIEEKTKYIKWQYSIFQNNTIKDKTELIDRTLVKQTKLEESLSKVTGIVGIQEDSLKKYNAKIISDIELLFHIYSGRIVQDFQGGLGLFIINKNDKIKFVTSPEKTYDAVFSMSNGQLSALVIAFTLALNKKYSNSNLLFIDDPVQSMDDMNTSGFVEVLRNDFNDRQIFISTHEIEMSTYIRYKFEKFNLSTKRYNVGSLINS